MEKEISNFKPSQDNFILGGWQPHYFINGVVYFSEKQSVFIHCFFKGKMKFKI